jgi:hypothetical protein
MFGLHWYRTVIALGCCVCVLDNMVIHMTTGCWPSSHGTQGPAGTRPHKYGPFPWAPSTSESAFLALYIAQFFLMSKERQEPWPGFSRRFLITNGGSCRGRPLGRPGQVPSCALHEPQCATPPAWPTRSTPAVTKTVTVANQYIIRRVGHFGLLVHLVVARPIQVLP